MACCPGGSWVNLGTGRIRASSSETGGLPQILLILVFLGAAHTKFSVSDSSNFILLNGCYFRYLKRFNKRFPPENIFLISRNP